jgi:hypothetical protein
MFLVLVVSTGSSQQFLRSKMDEDMCCTSALRFASTTGVVNAPSSAAAQSNSRMKQSRHMVKARTRRGRDVDQYYLPVSVGDVELTVETSNGVVQWSRTMSTKRILRNEIFVALSFAKAFQCKIHLFLFLTQQDISRYRLWLQYRSNNSSIHPISE